MRWDLCAKPRAHGSVERDTGVGRRRGGKVIDESSGLGGGGVRGNFLVDAVIEIQVRLLGGGGLHMNDSGALGRSQEVFDTKEGGCGAQGGDIETELVVRIDRETPGREGGVKVGIVREAHLGGEAKAWRSDLRRVGKGGW